MKITVGKTYLHKQSTKTCKVLAIYESNCQGHEISYVANGINSKDNSIWFAMEWESVGPWGLKHLLRRLEFRLRSFLRS